MRFGIRAIALWTFTIAMLLSYLRWFRPEEQLTGMFAVAFRLISGAMLGHKRKRALEAMF